MDSSFELCELERLTGYFFKFLGGVDLVIFRKFTFTAPTEVLLPLEPARLNSKIVLKIHKGDKNDKKIGEGTKGTKNVYNH